MKEDVCDNRTAGIPALASALHVERPTERARSHGAECVREAETPTFATFADQTKIFLISEDAHGLPNMVHEGLMRSKSSYSTFTEANMLFVFLRGLCARLMATQKHQRLHHERDAAVFDVYARLRRPWQTLSVTVHP